VQGPAVGQADVSLGDHARESTVVAADFLAKHYVLASRRTVPWPYPYQGT
jgi:hypothetical protein